MSESPDLPALRFHRLGGGYRREDVEAALEKLLLTMRTVEGNLERLRSRSAALESELEVARAELDAYRAREEQLEATLRRAEDALARVDGSVSGAER
jgi:chromosome segregation ATPase